MRWTLINADETVTCLGRHQWLVRVGMRLRGADYLYPVHPSKRYNVAVRNHAAALYRRLKPTIHPTIQHLSVIDNNTPLASSDDMGITMLDDVLRYVESSQKGFYRRSHNGAQRLCPSL